MEFILNIFSNLLLFLSFTLEKLVPIFSILFSGAFAGLIVQYWIRLYMKYDKVQKTANYAKLLAYETGNRVNDYKVIAENIKNAKKDIKEANGNTLKEKWTSILNYDLNKDKDNQICYAMLNVLSDSDIIFWNKNKKHFMHLPTNDFEVLHRYYNFTRKSANELYSLSNHCNNEKQSEISLKMSDYSYLISLYLTSLIYEAERPIYAYILKSTFINIYSKEYKHKLSIN